MKKTLTIQAKDVKEKDVVTALGIYKKEKDGFFGINSLAGWVNYVDYDYVSEVVGITFDSGLSITLNKGWELTVEREEEEKAYYFFKNHETKLDKIYTSGPLFDNATMIVREKDGVILKNSLEPHGW